MAASWSDAIEETLIAVTLGAMTLVTFANVVARKLFNSNLLWALETTVFLFAWLVLLGAGYCVKKRAHLGVDIVLNLVGPAARRILGLASAAACILFAGLLTYGAWEFWLPFFGKNAWYEVNDIRMFEWLRFIEPLLNEGEPYEKLPRFIPYFCLPLGVTLMAVRFLQAGYRIYQGVDDRLIASHEAEELLDDVARNAPKER